MISTKLRARGFGFSVGTSPNAACSSLGFAEISSVNISRMFGVLSNAKSEQSFRKIETAIARREFAVIRTALELYVSP